MVQNPLNLIADNPDNPFERAKQAIGEKVGGFFGSDTGQEVAEKASPILKGLEYVTTPYREYVAPALTSVLLQFNSNYREQNKNLSLIEQLNRGVALSKQQVDADSEFRRSVSPGRALVGLIGSVTPGTQGVDKIDWANSRQVNEFFSSGSAQFWSGFADLGFNFADPVPYGLGKGARVIRTSQLSRPLTSRVTNPTRLTAEVDDAVRNVNADTGIAQVFKLVEENPDNLAAIQAYGFVAGSANPAAFAVALSEAYKVGGRAVMGDVIKSSIGDIRSMKRLETQYKDLHGLMSENAGRTEVLTDELSKINTALEGRTNLSKEEVTALMDRKTKVKESIDAAEKAKEEAAYKAGVFERATEEFGVTQTWSQYSLIERIRTGLAKAQSEGIFLEVDPTKKLQLAKAVAKEAGTKTLLARTVMWVSPNQQLREVQSGIAFLGGAAGERSFLEADARIAQIGRLTGMSKDEMKSLSNDYRRLRGKSERFTFLDNLQERAFNRLLQKHYGQQLGKMTPVQMEAANAFVRELIQSTRRAQAREIKYLLEKKYTVTEHTSGELVAHQHIDKLVNQLAEERALEAGRSAATQMDKDFVRRTLQENVLTETQVPNVHFGVDLKMFDQVMSENPTLINSVVRLITEENWDATQIKNMMANAERSAFERADGKSSVLSDYKTAGKTALDVASNSIDQFYTYVWKPFTLLSFKYTTRNVAEGWLRILASMADFHSYYGYGYSEMWNSVREPGSISRYFQNRGLEKRSKVSRAKFDGYLQDLRRDEALIKKQIGEISTDGKSALKKLRKKEITEADKKIFEGADGMSMTIGFTKSILSDVMKTKTSGIKEADSALRMIKNNLIPLLDGKGNYGGPVGDEFIKRLLTGDYRGAADLSAVSDSGEILKALQAFRDEVAKTVDKLGKETGAGALSVSYMIDNSKYALSRMLVHADLTMELLVNRGKTLGQIKEISGDIVGKSQKRKAFNTEQVKISDFDGGIWIDASLAGEAGEMLRIASSSKVSTTRQLMDERSTSHHGLMSQGFQRKPVNKYEPIWNAAHADYVNNVMMRDGLIRTMVQDLAKGSSVEDMFANARKWIRSTDPEAAQWRREVNQNMTTMTKALDTKFSYEEQLQLSYVQIEQYLPSRSSVDGMDYNLYQRAVDGFTAEDSGRIRIQDREDVVTDQALHDKRMTTVYKNGVSRIFNLIGTMPEDHLARHPFFNMVYNNEARRIAKKYEDAGRAQKMSDKQIANYIRENSDKITKAAQNRAYKELMQRLYSVERYTGPAKLLRWITPFYMAHQNSSRFWLGTTMRNPQVAYNLAKAYNAPFRMGLVQDEEGNLVDAGLPWSPDANKQKMVFESAKLAKWTGKDTMVFYPTSLDVITQGQFPVLPTLGGPGGEIIGTQLIKYLTESTEIDSYLRSTFGYGIDQISSKYILPFYEKGYGQSFLSSAYQSTVPFNSFQLSLLATVYGATGNLPIIQDIIPQVRSRWNARYDAARDQVVIDMQFNQEPLDEDVIAERAASIARRSLLVEAVSSGIGPVVAGKTEDSTVRELNQRLTKYQNALGYNEGSAKLIAELDAEGVTWSSGVVSTLRSSTSQNRFGLYSNVATVRGLEANIDSFSSAAQLYKDNPFLGELFNIPGDGTYSAIADDLLYSIKVNGEPVKSKNMSPEDAATQAQMRAAWADYFDNLEYIRKDAENKGIKRGTDLYKKTYGVAEDNLIDLVAKQYPVWDTRDVRITLEKSDKFIELATYFTRDEKFMSTVGTKNPAIATLKKYLEAREVIVAELEKNRALTGVQGLDTKANEQFAKVRDQLGEILIAENPAFEQMWTRYLSRDELNVVSSPLYNGVN